MPWGENRVRCHTCLEWFTCGDCILSECPECTCQRVGHLQVRDTCARCGVSGIFDENLEGWKCRAGFSPDVPPK